MSRKHRKPPRRRPRINAGIRVDVYQLVRDGVFYGMLGFLNNDNPHQPNGATATEEQADAERQAELATGRVMSAIQEYVVFDDPYADPKPGKKRRKLDAR
jgi:hypothetical protein